MKRTSRWILLLTLAALAACGPVQSLTVIWEASAELEGAKAADGQKYAPYEVVAAEAYLDKALEEQAFADFEPAIVFGTKARDMARQAKQKTAAATSKATPPDAPPPGDTAADGMVPDDSGTPAPVQVVPVPEEGGQRPPPIIVPTAE
ncbi:MAG: DUF4398 domain-containing protein [Pseudomonadota bacterium]